MDCRGDKQSPLERVQQAVENVIPGHRDADLGVICIDVNLKAWENLRSFRVTVYSENRRTLRNSYITGSMLSDGSQQQRVRLWPERQVFVEPSYYIVSVAMGLVFKKKFIFHLFFLPLQLSGVLHGRRPGIYFHFSLKMSIKVSCT